MNIYGIRLTTADGLKTFDFMLNKLQRTSPYLLKNVDGLGPPELEMQVSDNPGEGSTYQGRRAVRRQIVMTIGYRPNYAQYQTVSDLRQELYALFDQRGGKTIRVGLRDAKNSTDVLIARGYVRRMDPNIFVRESELAITIDCMSPYLEAPTTFADNPSALPAGTVTNPGTADTPFDLRVPIIKAMTSFVLTRTGSYSASISFQGKVQAGDVIRIVTTYGAKKIVIIRKNTEINMLPFIDSTSEWFTLFPGETPVSFGPSIDAIGRPVFSFVPKYWGI